MKEKDFELKESYLDFIDLINKNDLYTIKVQETTFIKVINNIDKQYEHPLVYAIENNTSYNIVEYLISISNSFNVKTKDNKVPLFIAVEKEKYKIANCLLSQDEITINYINNNDENIFMYLCRKHQLNRRKLLFLLEHNLSLRYFNYNSKSKKTSLEYAIENGDYEVIKSIFDINFFKIYNKNFILDLILSLKKKPESLTSIEIKKN